MKKPYLFFLSIWMLLFTSSFGYLNETYNLELVTLEPYELAKFTIRTQDLLDAYFNVLAFAKDFNMSIQSSGEAVPFYFPFTKITSKLPYFRFRLFNYAMTTKTLNITFSCLNENKFCDISKIARVISIDKYMPSRARLGTDEVFAIVLSSQLLSKVSLPLNLYKKTEEIFIDFLIPDFINDFNYSSLTQDEDTYDSSFWNDVDTLTLPWLPFFTHCTNQNKRLILFDILENNPQNCTYRSIDQIKTIGNIPTTGFTPETDSCNLEYTCYHVQTGKGKSYGTPWYSLTGTKTLYYIYRTPITIQAMINRRSNQMDPFFQNLIDENSDALIPVNFKTSGDTPQTGVPKEVEMKISFFQVTQEERDIISVEVIMSNYAGSAAGDGLPYTLKISYEALDYFGMINSFRVGIIIYLVVFLFVSIVVLFGAWIIWRANKFIFSQKKKIHPTIKFYATFKITFFPQFAGTFYATITTIVSFSLVASYFKEYIDFSSFTSNFLLSNVSATALLAAERGRIGLACVIFSMFVLNKGMSLLIPVPTKEETKIIVKNISKKSGDKDVKEDSSDSSKSEPSVFNQSADSLLEGKGSEANSDQDSSISHEPKQEGLKIEGSTIITGLKRKQNHVMLICILASITLLFVVEPSGSTTTTDENATESSTLLMVLLMVADVIVILLLKHFLLKEILLLAPITTAFEIVQFILVMRADTFVMFILSYLLRTLLIVFFRIYLDPILKNLEVYVQKASSWLLRKKARDARANDNNNDAESLKWKNVELILKKSITHKDHFSIESIVFILVNYTTKQCARLMFPVYLLFTYFFPNENQIASLLGINQQQLFYYIVFWFFLLIPSFIMDVYILNILEIVHGHKLYDYLSYCEYRFNFRTTKWIASSRKMDRSVSPEHRSIHNFCFSKQFYFTITVTAWGILLFMSGMYILYANAYKPFADSILVPMFFIVMGIFYVLKWIFSKISSYLDLWRLPNKHTQEPSKRVEEEKKRLEKHFEVDKMIGTNFFRLFFIRENKDWIISNLKNFIGAENFHDNEGYLLRIYQKLVDEEIRENNEKKRKDFIQQKKSEHLSQLTLKDLYLAAEEQNKGELRPYAQEEKIPRIKKSIVKPLTYLLYHWYYFAKQNLYLMNLVRDIENNKIADSCSKCGQEYALKLVPQKPLMELLAQFRIQYAGLPFNKYEWRKFYEKKQQFKTLCDDCKFIDLMKKRKINRNKSRTSSKIIQLDSNKMNALQDDPFDSPMFAKENSSKPEVPPLLKKTLLLVYWEAKARLLHTNMKNPSSDQINTTSKRFDTQDADRIRRTSSPDEQERDADDEYEERDNQTDRINSNTKRKNKGSESARV